MVDEERRGFVSVLSELVGRVCLDFFWEVRSRVRVERMACEERMVEAWILRCALREHTEIVRGVCKERQEVVYFALGGIRSRCLVARLWDPLGSSHLLMRS